MKPIERILLCVQPDVRIVLEHAPGKMPRDRFDYVIRFTGL
jgi:hypothetical protein